MVYFNSFNPSDIPCLNGGNMPPDFRDDDIRLRNQVIIQEIQERHDEKVQNEHDSFNAFQDELLMDANDGYPCIDYDKNELC